MSTATEEQGSAPFVSFTKKWHNKPDSFIDPSRPELSVAGKSVVVAGGGTGIGKAIAVAFAQAGAASVSILGRRVNRLEEAAKEIQAAGPKTKVIYEGADFSQCYFADTALKNVAAKAGRIDIFVWCAGIMPEIAPVRGYDEKSFREGYENILMGAFNAIQAVLPVAAPGAKIFNISTGIAHINPMEGLFNYAIYKSAVIKVFDYLAAENPDLHVVNVQPGVVTSELNQKTGIPGQDAPELPGHFLVWLASSEAEFLKNKFVWVNWDAKELIERAEEIKDSLLLRVMLKGVDM